MTDHGKEARDKIRRSIQSEFIRMEDDFDDTRTKRDTVINKLFLAVEKIDLIDEKGVLSGETENNLKIMSTTLKALADKENANIRAIALKLKNQEQEIASSAAAKERIEIVLRATAPGKLNEQQFSPEKLEAQLSEMFDSQIQDFELKTNPKDLSE